MKKVLIAALVPALIATAFSSFAADTAPKAVTVDGGQVNFAGSVVAAPCVVDNDTSSQTVTLGQVPTNRLKEKGNSGAAVDFKINLSGCDLTSTDVTDPTQAANYTKARITFIGDSTSATTLALANTGDAAKGVGIQIFQKNQAVNVDGAGSTADTNLIDGTNSIPFSAAYVATGESVVAGSANAMVNFKVSYD
ncbi:type 1 fimbrial protein [Erwinia billingiae]|uniref:fimbrial protein n=1 Tax=Erwinia billingiae TaxID=182337 RepID=UPI00124737B1|nr:fimbrial protein [Erwinia billingiae]QEW32585.1 type 1 fimbrial protein [Erwinia billingiae]